MGNRKKLSKNDPCPCGSGTKWKRCHPDLYDKYGNPLLPAEVIMAAQEFRNLPPEPFEVGGFLTGRPFIDTLFQDSRMRAVGNTIYRRPMNETFHEFLLFIFGESMGHDWLREELRKPSSDRHILANWFREIIDGFSEKKPVQENPHVFGMKKTGNIRSLLSLGYDFYSLAHCQGKIFPNLLNRLKKKDQFQGARYEIAMGGIAVRAGFEIEWVNDKDKHVEFIGTHKITGDRVAFEAKSHFREGVFTGGKYDPEKSRIKIMDHIREALEQSPEDLPLIIFNDLNLPLSDGPTEEKQWFKDVDDALKKYGFLDSFDGTNFGALLVTNFSWHFHEDLSLMRENEVMTLFRVGKEYSISPKTIGLLNTAAKQYGFIPTRLDELDILKNVQ